MVQNALPDIGAMLKGHVDEAMKRGVSGQELKGLPKDGAVFLAAQLPAPGELEPKAAVIVQVSNYADFRDSLLTDEDRKAVKKAAGYESARIHEKDFYLVDNHGFAVVTDHKELAEEFTKKQAGLDTTLSAEVAKQFLESDVALYVDMVAVNKTYGEQIKSFRQLVPLFMGQVSEQAKLDKPSQEAIQGAFDAVFQLIDDSKLALVAAEFRPEGLAWRMLGEVGRDSKTNDLLKSAKPEILSSVGKLPQGQLGYWAMQVPPGLYKIFLPVLLGQAGGQEGKNAEEIKNASQLQVEAGPQSVAMSFNVPVEGIQSWTYKDAAKAAKAQLAMFNALEAGGVFQRVPLKEKPKVQADAQTYRGFKLNEISMTWDFAKLAETTPGGGQAMADGMKKMMGENTRSWFGTDGKNYIQITAKDWDAARTQLDNFLDGKNPAENNKPFQDCLRQLPRETTMTILMDLPAYIQVMGEFLGPLFQAQGLPVNIPPLKAEKGKAFLGMAVRLEPQRGTFDLWIPVTAIIETRKVLSPVLGNYGIQ
jgi:hypothetical protein